MAIEAPPIEEVAQVTPEENQWNGFLLGLEPHKFHWLMKSSRELEFCEAYCGGFMDLDEISRKIDIEVAHMEPRVYNQSSNNDQSKKA